MKQLHDFGFPLLLGIAVCFVILTETCGSKVLSISHPQKTFDSRTEEWIVPDLDHLPESQEANLIRYGKDLIANTAFYFGSKGVVGNYCNDMNCQNCHLNAGTVKYGGCFSGVASTYPVFRNRSGMIESVSFRINECMQRSMNGKPLDVNSEEMKAMLAYLQWLGKDVPKKFRPKGSGIEQLPYLNRQADTINGRMTYQQNCMRCHGQNGEGILNTNGKGYQYPPLWGNNSFNTGAGLFTISKLAGFIRNNMPYGTDYTSPVLSIEQSWDVAGYIVSQPRPIKFFAYDWKDISKKPPDYPFGPYADHYSETQHKYGPFTTMRRER